MKKLLLFLMILSTAVFADAQKINGIVKGTLKDSASGQGLHDATVSIITAKDSSLVSFTLSSSSGYFEIKNLASGNYVVLVSYQGFETLRKPFSIANASPLADLGNIIMNQNFKMLGEVVVEQAPIQIKGDTIAFNASSFKTNKPNATAEDLLKKLPGIQVEKDGTVKAQGENVQKIYVDGKEFFGNDPKMATKNLGADMIDGVELYDDMSEQSKFSGVDDGTRSKAINIKLKKDKNRGVFGRASAGYGTEDRYEAGVSANYFKGPTKVSVVARSNNANNIGFTPNDQVGIFGGGNFMRGGGFGGGGNNNSTGITRNATAGINYSDTWGKKLELTGSYFYNNINNVNNSTSYRQTFFPDSTVNRSQQGFTENDNDNHRFNLRLTYAIDSLSSIIYTQGISFQNSKSYRLDTTESFAIDGTDLYKVNDSRSERNNTGDGINWSNNLLYRRKLNRAGRTFSVNLSNTYSRNNRDGINISNLRSYQNGTFINNRYLNQNLLQDNASDNYGINASYTEPIGKGKVLEFNYSYNNNQNASDRDVFDINNASKEYDIKNVGQTNHFRNSSSSNRFGTNFRVVKRKYNYQLGVGLQQSDLETNNLSKGEKIKQSFTNVIPTASFNYQFARSKNLRFHYRGRTNNPGVTQLQDVIDSTNFPYLSRGNSGLKQEYSNNMSVNYSFFDMVKFRNFFFQLNFSNTFNKIVNNVTALEKGVQVSAPVNANGSYNVGGNFNIGFPINRMKGGNFNTTTFLNYNRDVSFANSVRNFAKNLSVGETVRLSYAYKEKLDASLGASINYNSVNYLGDTSQRTLNSNSKYYSYTFSADISYILPLNFVLSTDLDYMGNSGLTSGFNQNYFLWNAGFAKQMLKNKRGELKLSVFDILKQNRSVRRNFTDNYIEDVQNNVLQRYFMLTFTYNLNRMGGRNMPVQGGGVNRRMMR